MKTELAGFVKERHEDIVTARINSRIINVVLPLEDGPHIIKVLPHGMPPFCENKLSKWVLVKIKDCAYFGTISPIFCTKNDRGVKPCKLEVFKEEVITEGAVVMLERVKEDCFCTAKILPKVGNKEAHLFSVRKLDVLRVNVLFESILCCGRRD
jgi:hypothetical protein